MNEQWTFEAKPSMIVICKNDLERLKTNLFFEYVFPNQSVMYYEIRQIFKFSKIFKVLYKKNSKSQCIIIVDIVIRRLTHIQELQIRWFRIIFRKYYLVNRDQLNFEHAEIEMFVYMKQSGPNNSD